MTEPLFAENAIEAPEWGKVGMHLFGFTDYIATPPYEAQAKRLSVRFAEQRKRVPQRESWFDRLAVAVTSFRTCGELPDDELERECVLANAELTCLLRHSLGIDVAALMAAFHELAVAEGDAREAMVAKVQAMAAEGRLAAMAG